MRTTFFKTLQILLGALLLIQAKCTKEPKPAPEKVEQPDGNFDNKSFSDQHSEYSQSALANNTTLTPDEVLNGDYNREHKKTWFKKQIEADLLNEDEAATLIKTRTEDLKQASNREAIKLLLAVDNYPICPQKSFDDYGLGNIVLLDLYTSEEKQTILNDFIKRGGDLNRIEKDSTNTLLQNLTLALGCTNKKDTRERHAKTFKLLLGIEAYQVDRKKDATYVVNNILESGLSDSEKIDLITTYLNKALLTDPSSVTPDLFCLKSMQEHPKVMIALIPMLPHADPNTTYEEYRIDLVLKRGECIINREQKKHIVAAFIKKLPAQNSAGESLFEYLFMQLATKKTGEVTKEIYPDEIELLLSMDACQFRNKELLNTTTQQKLSSCANKFLGSGYVSQYVYIKQFSLTQKARIIKAICESGGASYIQEPNIHSLQDYAGSIYHDLSTVINLSEDDEERNALLDAFRALLDSGEKMPIDSGEKMPADGCKNDYGLFLILNSDSNRIDKKTKQEFLKKSLENGFTITDELFNELKACSSDGSAMSIIKELAPTYPSLQKFVSHC